MVPPGPGLVHGDLGHSRARLRGPGYGGQPAPAGPAGRPPLRPRGRLYVAVVLERVTELGLDQSFGKTGDCYDNAAVGSFFATLKRELAWTHGTERWATRAQLRSALFDYIEGFYNPHRIQERLRYLSPINFEQAVAS